MSNLDFDPETEFDPANFIAAQRRSMMTSAIDGLDANPDEAAKAIKLAQSTGVPSPVIYGDMENFEREHRTALTSSLLTSNEYLRRYVDSDPMASKVSNDDYATLDEVSNKLTVLGRTRAFLDAPYRAAEYGIKGFGEGFGDELSPGQWIPEKDRKEYPTLSSISSYALAPVEYALRAASGAMRFATEVTRGLGEAGYVAATGNPDQAKKFGREIAAIVEMKMQSGEGLHDIPPAAVASHRAKAWVESSREPPAQIHPLLDEVKTKANEEQLKLIDEAVSEAQGSTTKERSPELFAQFVNQHMENSNIGISGAKVVELYGDRVPTPDDGLLGWVPNIADQLAVARETGADVNVPLGDWIARVDPQVSRELHDSMRVVKGGITKTEAAEFKEFPQQELIDGAIPLMRHGAGLEPLFSIGDRKLTLSRMDRLDETKAKGQGPFHDFDLLDDQGNPLGYVNISEQKGGKELYIDMIEGIGEFINPNNFGPALIRDLLRQLKAEFPEAEIITGHRVSGARAEAGVINTPTALPRIKFSDFDAMVNEFKQLLGGAWRDAGQGVEAFVKPEWSVVEQAIIGAVKNELARVVPKGVDTAFGSQLRFGEKRPSGAYIQGEAPIIALALNSDIDTLGIARHEAIHHLRQMQFFKEGEWAALEQAAKEEGWLDRYGINERYSHLDESTKLEESVAEAFRDWKSQREAALAAGQELPKGKLDAIFEKLQQFLDAIKAKISQIIGREPTFDEIFQMVDRGEIGRREPRGRKRLEKTAEQLEEEAENGRQATIEEMDEYNKNAPPEEIAYDYYVSVGKDNHAEALKLIDEDIADSGSNPDPRLVKAREIIASNLANPKLSIDEPSVAPKSPFGTPRDVGMTVDQHRRYMKLIQERQQADLKASADRALREQSKRQTREWKAQADAMRPQVVEELNARPDIAADKFFGLGELYGEKLDRTYRLDWEALDERQRQLLPERYTVRKGGIDPEEAASMFGYRSAQELIDKLYEIDTARRESGLGRERFMRKLIDDEVNRRMEAEHGFLEKNIIEEARDQVLSENQLDLLHEETHHLGMMANAGGLPLTRDQLVRQIRNKFDNLSMAVVDADKFLHEAGKYGRLAEMALLKADPAEAFRAKQVQYFNTIYATMASAVEKQRAQLDRTAKPYQRNKSLKVDQEFVDHIQKLLVEAGYKIKRDDEDFARAFEFHGSANLVEFRQKVSDLGYDPDVVDWIATQGAKPIDQMTTAEFGEFKAAIDSLNHIGREVRKIEIAGEKQDFADFKSRVIENIKQNPIRPVDHNNFLYKLDASLTRMEKMLIDLDQGKELGPMWDAVFHPMTLSKTREFDMMTELADHMKSVRGNFDRKWQRSLSQKIPQDLVWDTWYDRPYEFTRLNLINMMLHQGTESGVMKLAGDLLQRKMGKRPTTEEIEAFAPQVKSFIDTHATKQDWDFVQAMWEPFKKWQGEMDTVSRNTSGKAPKLLKGIPVETSHGMYEGGYWPVIYDTKRSGINNIKDDGFDGVFGKAYTRPATSKGHLKERTGYLDAIDLDTGIEKSAGVMQETIHDIAFRDALIQANKVFSDKDIRGAIRKHYGAEYEAQLMPWLKRIAYQYSADPALSAWEQLLKKARMNLVSHTLPFSANVTLSPDVGAPNPKAWTQYLANREENLKFTLEKSNEVRHLVYNMDRDYNELMNKLTTKSTWNPIQKAAVEMGYYIPMKMSQEFRAATFVDQFQKARAAGRDENQAILIADKYVRERHGAASIVDLPAAMTGSEGMKMLTVFGGYFNTMYNWQRNIPSNVRKGEWSNAAVALAGTTGVGAFFGASLFNQAKEGDSWFKTITKALFMQPLQTVPVLNQAVSYAFDNFDPRMPISAFFHGASDLAKDAIKFHQNKPIEKPITHAANAVGLTTGLPLAQIGRSSQFLYDVHGRGRQKPRDIYEYLRGLRTGEARLRK